LAKEDPLPQDFAGEVAATAARMSESAFGVLDLLSTLETSVLGHM